MIVLRLSQCLLLVHLCPVLSFHWGPDSQPWCGPTTQCKDFQVCVSNYCQCLPNYSWSSTVWGKCERYQCQVDQDCNVHDNNHVCDHSQPTASCECRQGYVSNTSGVYCHKSTLDQHCNWESDCSTDPDQTCDHMTGKCRCRDGYHQEDSMCRPGTPDQHRNSYWYIYLICFGLVPIVSVAGCYCWRRRTWRKAKRADSPMMDNFRSDRYQQPPTLSIPRSPSTFEAEPQQAFQPYIISHPFTNINYQGTVPVHFNEPPPSYDSIHTTPIHQIYQAGTSGQPQAQIDNLEMTSQTINKTVIPERIYENLPCSTGTVQQATNEDQASPVPSKLEQLNMQI